MQSSDYLNTIIKEGTKIIPWGALLAVLQLLYNYSRDAFRRRQAVDELQFEKQKLSDQTKLEEMRQKHDRRRWREDYTVQMTLRLVDIRLTEYASIWTQVSQVAKANVFTPDLTRALASQIREWRYSKGGLLADDATRDAAFNFQEALWEFDGKPDSYEGLRSARTRFRNALRADMGLGQHARPLRLIEEDNIPKA